MAISFDSISPNVRASQTFIELNGVRRSFASLFIPPHVALVGQYDSAKTGITEFAPQKVVSADDVGSRYGFGSHIHRQALKLPSSVYTSGNGVTAFPVQEEVAGVAANGDVVFTGNASSAGTWYFLIGGVSIQVAVANGDTPTEQGDALVAAITASRDIAVSAANVAGTVTITAKGKGTYGNQIYIKQNPGGTVQENAAPGTTTVSGVDAFLTSGATDPDLHDLFMNASDEDILGDTWYTQFTAPYTDASNLGYYDQAGDLRADPSVRRPFGAYVFYVDQTYAQALAIPATINSKWIGAMWDSRAFAPAFELAAELTGTIAEQQNLAPNRPYKTLPLSGGADTSVADVSYAKQDALFRAGIGYCKVDQSGTIRLGDVPLTYRTDDVGGATEEWFDAVSLHLRQAKSYSIEQVFISDPYSRGVVVANEDVTAIDFAIAPKDVVSDMIKLVQDLWAPQAWTKNARDVIKSISAEINSGNNSRIDSTVTDDEAKALRIIATLYNFLF